MSTILVTGGAGFIGTHTCVELLEQGYDVVVLDDHSNSSPLALERVTQVAGAPVLSYVGDIRDGATLDAIFRAHEIHAVIHFAAKKAVGESVEKPLEYYSINVGGTLALVEAMVRHSVWNLVFSSSCSIYGDASAEPIEESTPAAPTNPYARSKWMCEQILADACIRHPQLHVIALRYFNPVGAHPSGALGEDPRGVPNNVLPYLSQAAAGRFAQLTVFGDDYPTPDGTGVRDYIHVMDVAAGHRVALEHMHDQHGMLQVNLGTGTGTSVLELIREFERASGRPVPYKIGHRRAGDVATLVADPSLARRLWDWRAIRTVTDVCQDMWRFQCRNPRGYDSSASAVRAG